MRISLLVQHSAIMLNLRSKLLAGILVLTLASSQAAVNRQETDVRLTGIEHLGRNSKLEAIIDSFREVIRNGSESMGLPVLDPYEADELIIKLDEGCLTIDNNLSNVRMEGLSGYTIDRVSFSLFRLRINVDLIWPNLPISTKYTIKGNTGVVPIYGSGTIKSNAKNVTFSSVTTIAVSSALTTYVRSFTSKLTLEALDFTITGLYDADEASQLTSTIVSSNAPRLMESYQEVLTGRLNVIIVNQLNEILSTMSLSDLINLIS